MAFRSLMVNVSELDRLATEGAAVAQRETVLMKVTEATAISGIEKIRWIEELPGVLHRLMCTSDSVFLNANEHDRAAVEVESRDERLGRRLMQRYPLHRYERLAPLLHRLRALKSPVEIELI